MFSLRTFLVCGLVSSLVTEGITQNVTFAEFLSLGGLCFYFGGQCGETCPHSFIRHKWDIPLCPGGTRECCIGLPTSNVPAPTLASTASDATTVTTPAPEYETCGILPGNNHRLRRVVGGRTAPRGSWPWLVALRNMVGAVSCSGAVISQRWVVTAAHCFRYSSSPSMWRVSIGEHDLITQEDTERQLRVQQILLHPEYSSQGSVNYSTIFHRYVNDIALIRLAEDSRVEPICLPEPHGPIEGHDLSNVIGSTPEVGDTDYSENPRFGPMISRRVGGQQRVRGENEIPDSGNLPEARRRMTQRRSNCWVAGWGATLDESIQDQVLREVPGEVLTNEQCSQMWNVTIPDNMVCFGDGSYGPCNGDSGAPMSCERNGQFYLTGVVSWGAENCNVTGRPSVFSRTRHFLEWIQQVMSQ